MNGYAVFHDVYDAETIQVLKDEMGHFITNYDMEADEPEDFETKHNNRKNFFLESAW